MFAYLDLDAMMAEELGRRVETPADAARVRALLDLLRIDGAVMTMRIAAGGGCICRAMRKSGCVSRGTGRWFLNQKLRSLGIM